MLRDVTPKEHLGLPDKQDVRDAIAYASEFQGVVRAEMADPGSG
jgi:thiamine biosynthesis protein ThiC